MWRDFTLDERTKLGEVQEVKFALAVTLNLMTRDIETARYLDWVARNESLLDVDQIPEGHVALEGASTSLGRSYLKTEWVKVPNGKIQGTNVHRYGHLADRWIPGPVWNDIRQVIELGDQEVLSKIWQEVLTAWKISKALALDTPIPTPTGWTTMGALQPGDMVFDENGKPCEVLQATETQLNHQCFEVEFSDGAKIVADAGHLWLTIYRGKPGVRETRDILATLKEPTRGDNNHSIPVAGSLELPDIELPVPPYVLGLWLGDGRRANACMSVGGEDAAEIMAHVTAAGVECGPTRRDGRNNVTYFHLRAPGVNGRLDGRRRDEAGQARLRMLGVLNNKHIPAIYLRASEGQRRELLQGLMDSDGHITDEGLCGFCTVDDALKDGALELIRSLGYKPTAIQYETRCNGTPARPAWKLHFKAYTDRPVFKLARKVARLCVPPETRQRSQTRQIVAVREVPSVPVRCILVSSPSHLFLAGDAMVPTHNTALSPVTHTNNVMSNFLLADAHDIQARHIYKAALAWSKHKTDPAMKELIGLYRDNGGDAGKFTENEIRSEVFDPLLEELRREIEADAGGVSANITAAQVIDLLQHRQFRQAFAAIGQSKKVLSGVAGAVGAAAGALVAGPVGVATGATAGASAPWIVPKLIKLYGSEDELFRLAAFIKAREDGLNDHDSGRFARESFLNYDIRAPWINAMRRSAWPFFAFTYRAAPMLARIAADKPHKVLKYHILSAILTGASYGMRAGAAYLAYGLLFGDADDEEEKERALLPDEKNGKIWGFMAPKLIRLPMDDRNGSPVFTDVRRWVPGGDIFDTGQTQSILPLPPPLSIGGPVGMMAEFATNKSAFTGRDIVDRKNDDWDEIGAKYADWLWKGVMPNNPLVPGTYSQQSLIDAARGRVNPGPHGDERTSMAQAALSAVGIKVGSYPIETLNHMAKAGAKAKEREIMTDAASKIGQIKRSGTSDGDKAEEERKAAEEKKVKERAMLKVRRIAAELREKQEKAGLREKRENAKPQ
jgi:hypothetical protein